MPDLQTSTSICISVSSSIENCAPTVSKKITHPYNNYENEGASRSVLKIYKKAYKPPVTVAILVDRFSSYKGEQECIKTSRA